MGRAGSFEGTAHRQGERIRRRAGEKDQAEFLDGTGIEDEDGPWDDAGAVPGAGLYQGWYLTQAGETSDNLVGDQVCAVVT